MAISISVCLLLVAIITAASLHRTSAAETPAPSQPPPLRVTPSPTPSPSTSLQAPPPPPPPPLQPAIQEKQFGNIIDALIGTGDFGGWANLLSSANPSGLPLTATLFIPCNDAITQLLSAATAGIPFDPLLIPYHIIPQRLTFSDLLHLANRTRLPTLLPSKFVFVTNNSSSNYTVDGSLITQPDIFLNPAFALHGVTKILDYSVFNGGDPPVPPPKMPENTVVSQWKKRLSPPGEITIDQRSGAQRSCTRISVVLSTFFAFLSISRFFDI